MFALINLSYLAAAVCFILGIKGMTRPKTAVRGNQLAAIGMLIAVVAALLHQEIISYAAIIAGMLLGGSIGVWLAKRTATTEMPELVASLNGIGGGASVAVAASTWMHAVNATGAGSSGWTAAILASIVIGSVTLTGSVVAVLKLKGNIGDSRNNRLWHSVTLVTLIAAVTGAVLFATSGSTSPLALAALVGLCLLLGIGLVQPIGGADMPVSRRPSCVRLHAAVRLSPEATG